MIKKIIALVMVIALSLPLFAFTPNVKTLNDTNDRRVSVEVVRDGTTLTINHTSGLSLTHAVIEYAYIENNIKYAQLVQLPVTNSKTVIIQSNWIALKVHQVKVYQNRVYYTYMTDNLNTIGDLSNVNRIAITEIETVATKTVKTGLSVDMFNGIGGPLHKYYEFYFNFDKRHDELVAVDISYVMVKKPAWFEFWKDTVRENVTNGFTNFMDQTIHGFVKQGPLELEATQTIKTLERNPNSEILSDYVVRIAPSGTEGFTVKDYHDYSIENVAIIKIRYKVDGEFIVDDVINNPTTPIDDAQDWFLNFIEELKNFIEYLQNLDWDNVITWALVIGAIIIGMLLLGPVISIITLMVKLITLLFKLPSKLAQFIKWLFIPKKKKGGHRK